MSDDHARLSRPSHWESRYVEGTTPWDLGAPPEVIDRLAREVESPARVLVPGAGYGHDAIGWARAGHDAVAADFAPSAVAGARDRAAQQGLDSFRAEVVDVFEPPTAWLGSFDVVSEQTLLCAIDPTRRAAYVEAIASVLRPGGQLFAILWNNGSEGGPPFDLTPQIVRPLLETHFDVDGVEWLEPGEHPRPGQFLVRARRRHGDR